MIAIIPIELIDILPVALQRLQRDTKKASEINWRFTQRTIAPFCNALGCQDLLLKYMSDLGGSVEIEAYHHLHGLCVVHVAMERVVP